MQFNYKIPLIIAFVSAVGLTAFGTTLTTKDYNNYIQSEHKILGIEVNPLVAFSCWNASFIVRQMKFYGPVDEAINRGVGMLFFLFMMAASGIPSYMGYSLSLMTYNKINNI